MIHLQVTCVIMQKSGAMTYGLTILCSEVNKYMKCAYLLFFLRTKGAPELLLSGCLLYALVWDLCWPLEKTQNIFLWCGEEVVTPTISLLTFE